ncbi:MAG TPA: hypothetical protein VGE27_00295 [Gemmatimonas sp.]|uniref:peptidase MA family metallohydrolase n=1 Tax=Gemmatimonas sp. TaxID=1962908 RepID=UPI002ED99305
MFNRTLHALSTVLLIAALIGAGAGASSLPAQAAPLAADAKLVPSTGVRLDEGRFTVVSERRDERLARALLTAAQANDTFPGLPRPRAHVLIAIAPDMERFRAWVGPYAPEWGAAIAFPDEQRLVMQGSAASTDAGDPLVVLRHELAHLALHEHMDRLPTRWFDEGYASVAAGEFTREQMFETSIGMVWRTLPSLEALENGFRRGGMEASWSYAMAHRIVSELTTLGGPRGLDNFFAYWKSTGSFEKAVREAYGITGEAFEKHWQQQTRRRYGALAVVTNVSAAVGLFAILLVPLFVSKRRRDRRRLEAMRIADAQQEAAARASALQALLDAAARADDAADPDGMGSPSGFVPDSGTRMEPPAGEGAEAVEAAAADNDGPTHLPPGPGARYPAA